jgi:hypothetical protein
MNGFIDLYMNDAFFFLLITVLILTGLVILFVVIWDYAKNKKAR